MIQFQILLHATELKLLYTAEVKESPSEHDKHALNIYKRLNHGSVVALDCFGYC